MTETARTYAIVLYELGIPEEMVREAVKLLKENPELPEVLNSPVVPLKSKHAVIEKVFRDEEASRIIEGQGTGLPQSTRSFRTAKKDGRGVS